MNKKVWKYAILFLLLPTVVLLSVSSFFQKSYAFITAFAVVLSCVPFFISFEKKQHSTRVLIVISVMTALSVAGRALFAPIPAFKPITAIVIICGIYFGPEAGFMCGALSAVVSNFYFGQGPWTVFQMFAWGLIGLLAGYLNKPLKNNTFLLCAYGALGGVAFSLVMDIWTVMWNDNVFNIRLYLAAVATAVPVIVVYAVSNVVFLILLKLTITKKIERIKTKYGI